MMQCFLENNAMVFQYEKKRLFDISKWFLDIGILNFQYWKYNSLISDIGKYGINIYLTHHIHLTNTDVNCLMKKKSVATRIWIPTLWFRSVIFENCNLKSWQELMDLSGTAVLRQTRPSWPPESAAAPLRLTRLRSSQRLSEGTEGRRAAGQHETRQNAEYYL